MPGIAEIVGLGLGVDATESTDVTGAVGVTETG